MLNLLQVIHNSGFQKKDTMGCGKSLTTICVSQRGGDLNFASGTPRTPPWMHAWWEPEMPLSKDGRECSLHVWVIVISFTHPSCTHCGLVCINNNHFYSTYYGPHHLHVHLCLKQPHFIIDTELRYRSPQCPAPTRNRVGSECRLAWLQCPHSSHCHFELIMWIQVIYLYVRGLCTTAVASLFVLMVKC